MAKITFKSYNQNDNLLLPPCLGDYLPQNHKARVVSAIIDRLDISEIEKSYKGCGTSGYHPRMLLKVIVYSCLDNVYSGRKMEALLTENIAYMWLSGRQTPDFRTINLFRSQRLDGRFDGLFTQVVALLNEEGFVSLNVQYIDVTKVDSVANKNTFVWKGSVEKNKARLEEKVKAVLGQAEQSLELERTEEESEMSAEEMERRADNILNKMDKRGISDKRMRKAKELLTSARGLHHRSNRPIEPEAVFGNIKYNHGFRRFLLKSNKKVRIEFGLVALAHNIRKYIAVQNGENTSES